MKSSVYKTTALPTALKLSLFSHKDIVMTVVDSDDDGGPFDNLDLSVADPKYSFALDRSKPGSRKQDEEGL